MLREGSSPCGGARRRGSPPDPADELSEKKVLIDDNEDGFLPTRRR